MKNNRQPDKRSNKGKIESQHNTSHLSCFPEDLEFYRFSTDNACNPILWTDSWGSIIYANKSFAKLIGYSEEELLKMKVHDIGANSPKEDWLRCFGRLKQKGVLVVETNYRREDGSIISVEVTNNHFLFKGAGYNCIVFRDLTQHKLLEDKLAKSKQKYQAIIKYAMDGLCLIDPESYMITDCNPALERLTGRTSVELKKMKVWEINPPEKQEEAKQVAFKIKEEGFGVSNALEFLKPNGEIVNIGYTVTKVKVGDKDYFLGITRDITSNVLADREIKKILQNEKRLRRKLQSEIERRIQFTKLLVHELKTPLTPIISTSELITQITQDEPLNSYARNIFKGANRLNKRIDELLDIARGEMGILQLNLKNLKAVEAIKEICSYMMAGFEQKKQTFVQNLPDKEIHIRADEERFTQILINLLDNARKFTPERGNISLKAQRSEDDLLLEITDTGYGMTQGKQRLIFQPRVFSTADNIISGGLGLGLTLCKMLVKLHGGGISVDSKVNEGTIFRVTIPLCGVPK